MYFSPASMWRGLTLFISSVAIPRWAVIMSSQIRGQLRIWRMQILLRWTKTGLHCALHRQETRIRSSTAWLSSWWSAPLVYRASDAYFHVCEYLFTPDHQQGSTTWRINLPPLWQPPLFCFHSNWPMLLRWLLIDFQFMFLNSFPRKPFLNCGPTIWSTTPPTHALTWYDHWPMYGPLCWLFYLTERSFPRLIQVPIVKRVAAAVVKQTEAGSMTPAVARWVC